MHLGGCLVRTVALKKARLVPALRATPGGGFDDADGQTFNFQL